MANKRGPYKGRKEYGATTTSGLGAEWKKLRAEVLDRDGHICHYCGNAANSVDHIIPRSQGGESTLDNCVAACTPCNSSKRDRIAPRTSKKAASAPRVAGWYNTKTGFGPCSRQWHDEFEWMEAQQ